VLLAMETTALVLQFVPTGVQLPRIRSKNGDSCEEIKPTPWRQGLHRRPRACFPNRVAQRAGRTALRPPPAWLLPAIHPCA